MKKIFYFLASAIVALGAMACQNEVDESINPNTQSDVVSFTVAFDEATRIAMTTEGKTANFAFEADDVLYVWPRSTNSLMPFDPHNEPYVFTTEDGETFSCKSAELVEALEETDNHAIVSNARYRMIDSYKGIDGFLFCNAQANDWNIPTDISGKVTLNMLNSVLKLTVPEDTEATLVYSDGISLPFIKVSEDGDTSLSTQIVLASGDHMVAVVYAEGGTLSYSINDVVVKSITKDFEAGKIYNLGTLGYEFTTINTKEQLIAFAEHVNAGNNYKDKTVKLGQSIDLEGEILAPIGNSKANAFRGNFDGQGNTISNFTVEHAEVAGLFGMLAGGSIKNLNVNKATIYGNSYAGGIVAWVQATSYQGWQGAADAVVDNCNVTYTEITSTVINNDNAAKVGGIAGYVVYGTISNSTVANTNITAYRDMGGIAGMANFASSNGKGAVISGNTVGENVTITVDNSTNYNNYTTADQYNVASIVGRISTGAIVENNTGEATIVLPKTAVEELNEQIANSEGNTTITLTEDIVAGENEMITIPAGKTITLNLNGKTISQEKECTASHQLIKNNGTLTITGNGKISFKDTSAGDSTFGWGSYTIHNSGNLTVENGTIEHIGEQAFATHMICAIFQYSGTTTINGGVISTPNYRSVRLWKGNMTINGGEFDGQLWVQAVDNTANLVITDGTFGPNGGDGSSVFVENKTYTVDVEITGGTFTTKLGASNAVKGWVKGGQFGVDPTAYVADGYKAIENEGVWTVNKLEKSGWEISDGTPFYLTQTEDLFVAYNVTLSANKFCLHKVGDTAWGAGAKYGLVTAGTKNENTAIGLYSANWAGDITIDNANTTAHDIYFDKANSRLYVLTVGKTPAEITAPTNATSYNIAGTMNNWGGNIEGYKFTYAGDDVWHIVVEFAKDAEFKVQTNNDWNKPNYGIGGIQDNVGKSLFSGSDNAKVKAAGTYEIWVVPAHGGTPLYIIKK